MGSASFSITYQTSARDGPLPSIRVRAAAGDPCRGWLTADGWTVPVALGRGGILANKREGDGGTPRGSFHPRKLWWRADRHPRPRTHLAAHAIRPEDAWCEDPNDRHYNQPIRLNSEQGGDRLTRKDHLYDFIREIDNNTRPRQRRVPASGARELWADRRLCVDDTIRDATSVAAAWAEDQNNNRMREGD